LDLTITSINPDNEGNIWTKAGHFLGQGRILVFDSDNLQGPEQINQCLDTTAIRDLDVDSEGNLWVLSGNEGLELMKYDGNECSCYTPENSIPVNEYGAHLTINNHGNKLIGTNLGITKFDDINWTTIETSNSGLVSNWVNSVSIDSEGKKWFGTKDGLVSFSDPNWSNHTISNSEISTSNFQSVTIDGHGNKWCAITNQWGSSSSLVEYNEVDWEASILDWSVQFKNLYADMNDMIWIATDDYGLWNWNGYSMKGFHTDQWWDGSNYHPYENDNSGIPSLSVRNITSDNVGKKWIATDNGIARYDISTWTVFNESNTGAPINNAHCVVGDSGGRIWVGSESCVAKYDGNSWAAITALPEGRKLIAIDENNIAWVVMSNGTVALDTNLNVIFEALNQGLENFSSIAIDTLGNKWIGTYNWGVYVLPQSESVVGIEDEQPVSYQPSNWVLNQNYPNPFNPSTTIRYGLPESSDVSLVIYDVRGQVVQTLESGHQNAGWYDVVWNGETADGKQISTGIYFARLLAGDNSQVIKMLYLK